MRRIEYDEALKSFKLLAPPDSVYSVKSQPMQNRTVACLGCGKRRSVRVSRQHRLRTLRSNCCNRRLRPVNWAGWKDGRARQENQVHDRRVRHAEAQALAGIVRCPNPQSEGRCGCGDPDGICEADHLDVSET